MPGSPVHLARRFIDVLTATPLKSEEITAVRVWARPSECALFFSQPDVDQRHGYDSALAVVSAGFKENRIVTAALMHDIGKRHTDLGILGRTFASILIILRLPLPRRYAAYRDHGISAAEELSEIGSDPMVIAYARSHHGIRPPNIDLAAWRALTAADEPPKARTALRRWITWLPL